jgi:hypothetical protein
MAIRGWDIKRIKGEDHSLFDELVGVVEGAKEENWTKRPVTVLESKWFKTYFSHAVMGERPVWSEGCAFFWLAFSSIRCNAEW